MRKKSTHRNIVTLRPLDVEETSFPGFPHTLKNLENQQNDQINFQAWERKKFRNVWNNPGNFLTDIKLELSVFLEEINDRKAFCNLLITNYGHGTGLPGQGNFSRSGKCQGIFLVREF